MKIKKTFIPLLLCSVLFAGCSDIPEKTLKIKRDDQSISNTENVSISSKGKKLLLQGDDLEVSIDEKKDEIQKQAQKQAQNERNKVINMGEGNNIIMNEKGYSVTVGGKNEEESLSITNKKIKAGGLSIEY